MMRRLHVPLAIGLVFASSLSGLAQLDSAPAAVYLDRISSAIVVGTAIPGTDEPSRAGGTRISILRVLKGSPNLVGSVVISQNASVSPACRAPLPKTSVTALWFLTSEADGGFAFAPSPKSQSCNPFSSDYEVPSSRPTGDWSYSDQSASAVKLAYELAASFAANQGSAPLVFLKYPPVLVCCP